MKNRAGLSPKTWIVVRREFFTTIRRKGWLIATFGMPFFLLLYIGIASLAGLVIGKEAGKGGEIGIVDLSGIVRLPEGGRVQAAMPDEAREALEAFGAVPGAPPATALPGVVQGETAGRPAAAGVSVDPPFGEIRFRTYADEPAGRAALDADEIKALYVIPRDWVTTGKAVAYDGSNSILSETVKGESALEQVLVRSLLAEKADSAVIERVLSPLSTEVWTHPRGGEWQKRSLATILASFAIPLALSLLLLISVMINAGQLLEGVSEEKENRAIEVILSSIDAPSLLAGKLIGLGAAGMLQLTIWLLMAIVPAAGLVAGLAVRPGLVLVCLTYFLLGFVLFGTLITATGALGTNSREAQQYGMVWSVTTAIPWMFFSLFLTNPDGWPARLLSWFPLTAPISMMMRASLGHPAWWEYLLSLALLALATWVALRLSARMFRTALLMYGKRPTIPEVFRWLRQAG